MKYIECGRKGVYFLLDGMNIVYIGCTSDFPRRVMAHYDKKFDKMRFIPCDRNQFYEKRLIKIFKPKYNVLNRQHGKALCALGHRDKATSKFLNSY